MCVKSGDYEPILKTKSNQSFQTVTRQMFITFLFSNTCEAYIYHAHSKLTTYLNSLAYAARSKITYFFTTICCNVFNSNILWEIFDSKHIDEVIDSRRNSEKKNT